MGFEPTIHSEAWGGTDKSWIRTRKGLSNMRPIMLDMSTFLSNHIVDGKIPSGTALGGPIDGSPDYYGPYAGGGTDESVSLVIDAAGGTFTLTFDGETTANIDYDATAAEVKSALEALSNVEVGEVVTAGGPCATAPVVITWKGERYGEANAPALTADAANLTGGAGTAVPTTTSGAAGATDGTQVFAGHLFEDVKVPHEPNVTPDLSSCADVAVALYWEGVVLESELPAFAGTTKGEVDDESKAAASGKIEYW